MEESVLIVGGAGYIGSHMVRDLTGRGISVVVLDDLSSGKRDAVGTAELIEGDMADEALLDSLFQKHRFDCVMHFASYIQVGESVRDPGKYYDNNVGNTVTLLNAMVRHRVGRFIFSSTAAIFGNPVSSLIDESHPTIPVNPYGRSKLMIEHLLPDYQSAYGLQYGCLRYFNAAGAHPDGTIGECHEPETHLIPLVLQAAAGRIPSIQIFGTDYPTPDGTCVRDYVHVCDLAEAHYLLWNVLREGHPAASFNLGTGTGYSVHQVIETAKRVTGNPIPTIISPRRSGDPAILVADGSAAKKSLGWHPRFSDIETIISHAWQWEKTHYEAKH